MVVVNRDHPQDRGFAEGLYPDRKFRNPLSDKDLKQPDDRDCMCEAINV